MRFRRRFLAIAILALLSAAMPAAQNSQQLFQQALSKEQADGKLDEAIQLYQRVIKEAGTDRALTARALLQIGRCYEKLGQSSARASYERVIKEYGDQTDVVAQARTRLAGLPHAGGAGGGVITRPLPNGIGSSGPRLLSPDGTKAVVFDFATGQNLCVYDVVTKNTTPITTFDWISKWAGHPVWSTDGRRIAYMQAHWKADGGVAELRVATLDGKSQTIFTNAANPEGEVIPRGWSPDGRTLLAVVNRKDKTSSMGFIALTGGGFTPLRSFPWAVLPSPRLSPDGRFIAYVDGPAELGDIHVLSADGRVDHRVINQPGDDRQPQWSPDGRHLAFISHRSGTSTLFAVAVKDGEAVGEPIRIKEAMQAAELMDWTPRGLSYFKLERTSDIYTVAADPATLIPRGTAQQLPYARTGFNFRATWSPDGKQFAFIANDPAVSSRRYVVIWPAGGGDGREFLIPTGTYQYPNEPYDLRWFGDGRGVGFSGIDAKGGHAAFRLTLATGEWKTDTLPMTQWTRMEWNHDGSAYFYARHGAGIEDATIVERNFQDHRERVVYRVPMKGAVLRELTLSPDRRSIALVLSGNHTVVDIATGEAYTVTKLDPANPAADTPAFHGWAPDGRSLILGVTRGGKNMLVLAPVRGGEQRPLTFEQSQLGLPSSAAPDATQTVTLRWSPDGARVAIGFATGRTDAFMIENPLAMTNRLSASAR